jgi:hypothetical protein
LLGQERTIQVVALAAGMTTYSILISGRGATFSNLLQTGPVSETAPVILSSLHGGIMDALVQEKAAQATGILEDLDIDAG